MRLLSSFILILVAASPALAQADTARTSSLTTVVVTAERSPRSIASSVASVTRVAAAQLARTPRATLADVLRWAPGFTLVDLDGLGFDPQLMVRGFYGGGEAEYVAVLIDGRPVNQLQTGLVAWDVLPPLSSIEALEIVRGSASPLYGDAAIGGVINVITRSGTDAGARLRWDAGGGAFGTARASIDAAGVRGTERLALGAGLDRTEGYRDHSERTAGRARASFALASTADATLALTARSQWREFQEPGPLLESLMAERREGSDPIFRYDETTDRSHMLSLDGGHRLGARTRLGGSLAAEVRDVDATRTLALAPGFGDTKRRDLSNDRAAATLQLDVANSPLPGTDHLIIGAEAQLGWLESKYYRIASGTRDDYEAGTRQDGGLDTEWDGGRTTAALYAQYAVEVTDALRFAAGGRFDRIRDEFDPRQPSGLESTTATHSAFSPRVGVNVRYLSAGRGAGNVYATVSQSFKAPTLDQLYDLRNIPVPFPPFEVRTSNPDLDPQRGTSYEVGIYHDAGLTTSISGSLSLSVYQMDMRDELDIDLTSFSYVNIGRSRHRGVETGVNVSGSRGSVFANYSLQSVKARSGDNSGNYLKAIPQHSVSGGVTVNATSTLETSLLVSHVRDVFLDDANTVELPDYTRVDARATFRVLGVSLFAEARNLFDETYSSSGFLDPAGTGEAYLYPAAGRVFELGIRRGW